MNDTVEQNDSSPSLTISEKILQGAADNNGKSLNSLSGNRPAKIKKKLLSTHIFSTQKLNKHFH